jgi:DNA-binding LytR/AlgR family response regulator
MKIKCIIIDDEPIARKGLRKYIDNIDFLELVGECENALNADTMLKQNPEIDLLLLDINMPKLSGLDFLKTLKNPPMVILTTAYSEYAIEGFKLDVIDYLLKPISFEAFVKAANKAYDFFSLKRKETKKEYFFIKTNNVFIKIFLNDIVYIQGLKDYVHIFTSTNKYITLINLKNIENQLQSDNFLRVHKSYIISKSKVDSIQYNKIKINDISIPIGKSYREVVYNEIIGNKLIRRCI